MGARTKRKLTRVDVAYAYRELCDLCGGMPSVAVYYQSGWCEVRVVVNYEPYNGWTCPMIVLERRLLHTDHEAPEDVVYKYLWQAIAHYNRESLLAG